MKLDKLLPFVGLVKSPHLRSISWCLCDEQWLQRSVRSPVHDSSKSIAPKLMRFPNAEKLHHTNGKKHSRHQDADTISPGCQFPSNNHQNKKSRLIAFKSGVSFTVLIALSTKILHARNAPNPSPLGSDF